MDGLTGPGQTPPQPEQAPQQQPQGEPARVRMHTELVNCGPGDIRVRLVIQSGVVTTLIDLPPDAVDQIAPGIGKALAQGAQAARREMSGLVVVEGNTSLPSQLMRGQNGHHTR